MVFSDIRRPSPSLRTDLVLLVALVALAALAKVLPHAPNFSPVAAAALFSGSVFRFPSLAPLVPLAGLLIGDAIIGFDDPRIAAVVYAALVLPAVLGTWGRRFRSALVLLPLALASSLIFFIASNFAVWAFSGMYAHDLNGLVRCYVVALPFLHNTIVGDLVWTAVLFGSWWAVRAFGVGRPEPVSRAACRSPGSTPA